MRYCPICEKTEYTQVWKVNESPLLHLVRNNSDITQNLFAPLEIVRCCYCGHMYNRCFDMKKWEFIYQFNAITNTPVHYTMMQFLGSILEWIGLDRIADKDVIEVGAGSGYFARALAQYARSVQVFEPNPALLPEMVPEPNITLVNEGFSVRRIRQKADLVICRQVLEHVSDPLELLMDMKKALNPKGCLYIEVPNASYIENHNAFIDFHNAHVHYFYRRNLIELIEKAGLESAGELDIKGGHDMGFILRSGTRIHREKIRPCGDKNLGNRLSAHLHNIKHKLLKEDEPVLFYGAAWHAVSLLSVLGENPRIKIALDDTEHFENLFLYSKDQVVPVVNPRNADVTDNQTVVITAFLHQHAITQRLRKNNFRGTIVTLTE